MARSVWFPGPGKVELRDERLPPVGAGEVRIRSIVSALSHGTEMLVFRGQVPGDLDLDLPTLRGSFEFPIKYGYASVGHIVEVGEDGRATHDASPREGDLVFVHHPHQTEYTVPASLAVPLPPGLDPEAGALFASVETAVNVLLDAHPRLGERVLILGQGVIGLILTQLVRMAGADLIIAVDPIDRRRDLSRSVGSDIALSPCEDLPTKIRELTDGAGADLALEASGSPTALDHAIESVAFQGTVVVCSWYGTKPVTLSLGGAFHRRRLRLIGSQVGAVDPGLQPRWTRARRSALARDLLLRLQLSSLITHRFPIERVRDAYELVDQHSDQAVQVMLTYGDV